MAYSKYFSKRETGTESDFGGNAISFSGKEENYIHDVNTKLNNEFKLNENHQIEFGGKITQNYAKYEFLQNETNIYNNYNESTLSSAYIQDAMRFFKIFKFIFRQG